MLGGDDFQLFPSQGEITAKQITPMQHPQRYDLTGTQGTLIDVFDDTYAESRLWRRLICHSADGHMVRERHTSATTTLA